MYECLYMSVHARCKANDMIESRDSELQLCMSTNSKISLIRHSESCQITC